jgi:hypothetical protein
VEYHRGLSRASTCVSLVIGCWERPACKVTCKPTCKVT